MLLRPTALLLDFHGVIAEGTDLPGRAEGFLETLGRIVGDEVPPDEIREDLAAGQAAYARWRDAMCRPYAPRELRQQEFWADYVAADWPERARRAVRANAAELCYRSIMDGREWRIRPGILDAVEAARAAGLPVAVVSNTLCGAAFRAIIAGSALAGSFKTEIYSDEVRLRKPNPRILRLAAERIDVSLSGVWFVGDRLSRDVLCGLRAGVGAAILMGDGIDRDGVSTWVRPHITVADATALARLLASTLAA